jgi:hypothetical protein
LAGARGRNDDDGMKYIHSSFIIMSEIRSDGRSELCRGKLLLYRAQGEERDSTDCVSIDRCWPSMFHSMLDFL